MRPGWELAVDTKAPATSRAAWVVPLTCRRALLLSCRNCKNLGSKPASSTASMGGMYSADMGTQQGERKESCRRYQHSRAQLPFPLHIHAEFSETGLATNSSGATTAEHEDCTVVSAARCA